MKEVVSWVRRDGFYTRHILNRRTHHSLDHRVWPVIKKSNRDTRSLAADIEFDILIEREVYMIFL